MKRGKDDEKMMGPMFPRLHVNDTEKGGPRAPPRNKMALYEQLSIPSHRFNPAHTNNTSSPVYPASSSQGNGLERNYNFPLPPSIPTHQGEKFPAHRSEGSGLNNSLAQLEQRKKVGDEDDFIVPVFVQSGTGQSHSKTLNSNDREKIASFSPTYSGRSTKHKNACDKNPKLITSPHINLGQEVRCESEGDPRLSVSSHSVISATDLSTREKFEGLVKETKAAPDQEYQDCPATNISSSYDFDASLQQEFRTRSQPVDTGFADSVRDEDDGKVPHPRSITHLGEANSSPNEPNNGSEYYRVRTNVSPQVGNVDGSDDVSETSMVDSISGFDISPDDVVGIIGQKHFWKARKAIVKEMCDPNRVTLHKATPETVDHLIIHCPFAYAFSDIYLSRVIIA